MGVLRGVVAALGVGRNRLPKDGSGRAVELIEIGIDPDAERFSSFLPVLAISP